MITDLFNGYKCTCGNQFKESNSLTFRRLKELRVKNGLDYLCECLKCKKTFRIEFIRWGARSW